VRALFLKIRRAKGACGGPQRLAPAGPIAPAGAGGNILPFARRAAREAQSAPALTADVGLQIRFPSDTPGAPWIAFVALSIAAHAGLLASLSRAPEPLAGVELPAISVELVFGADTPAGLAQPQGREEATEAPGEETEIRRDQPANPTPPSASNGQPEQTPAPAPSPQPPAVEPASREPDETATIAPQTPTAMAQTAEPASAQAQRAPDAEAITAPSESMQQTPEARPPRQPARRSTTPARERAARHANERPHRHDPGARRAQAGGVGIGRSPADPNYNGLVAAHLARYKQFPPEARAAHLQGSATVRFGLDGHGSVAFVRLVRGTGIASIDQEAQAMVRRASPFPPPPGGRPMTFTVPVSFHFR
jgi:protein TonB